MTLRTLRAILPLLLLITGALSARAGTADSTWTMMSFNLRYAGGDTGEHSWEARREAVAQRVRGVGADIVATQECLALQAEDLRRLLPDFALAGVGRDDGDLLGEMCAILWRRDRFIKLEEGHRWHAEPGLLPSPPDADAACVRMFSWVLLAEKSAPGRRLLVVDTHLDHVGAQARERAALRLRTFLQEHARNVPVVVMGDFNCPAEAGSRPWQILTEIGLPQLKDSFRALHAPDELPEGTFHGFTGKDQPARIDWILSGGGLCPLQSWIDRQRVDGVVPSDHHPVVTVFQPPVEGVR